MLLPLARLRAREGAQYFTLAPDREAGTYWQAPDSRTGGVAEFVRGTDTAALLAAAVAHWSGTGERRLASLLPDLLALREAMVAVPAAGEPGDVSISVYPLF